jgi:DNA-binding transcriptional LysR family regulator
MQTNLDIAALRSLAIGIDLGSFAKAADRVGRSTSAVSAQIKKLEEQAGTPLFRKSGRGLALTDAGEVVLGYARRLVELNDEATTAVRGVNLEGWVGLGLQEDFGEAILPEVLGRFARAHSKVRIEARVARNAELCERIASNELDLALVWGESGLPGLGTEVGTSGNLIASPAMCWIGSSTLPLNYAATEPIPLVAFNGPCLFFSTATAALDQAGIPWRVAFTSPSLAGLWAAAAAGLGVTVRTRYGLPTTVAPFESKSLALPALPSIPLVLLRSSARATPLVELLASIMLESLQVRTRALERVPALCT